jgi:ferredoxin
VPRVTFQRLGKAAEVRGGETILDAARRADAPIGNSCGGIGTCGRCRVLILDGVDHVDPRTTMEQSFALRKQFATNERLACQCLVRGECVVTTTYW